MNILCSTNLRGSEKSSLYWRRPTTGTHYKYYSYIWCVFFKLSGCYHTFNCNSPRDGSIKTFSLEIVCTTSCCFNQKCICTIVYLAILKWHFTTYASCPMKTYLYLSVFKIKKYICINIFFWLFHHVTILNIKKYSLPLTERKTTDSQIQPSTRRTIWTRIFSRRSMGPISSRSRVRRPYTSHEFRLKGVILRSLS